MLLQPIDSQFVAKAFFFSLVVARKIEQFSSMLKSLHAQEPSGSFARVQNESRITPMRRILSFHGFYLLLDVLRISLRLTALDCLKRRKNP